MNAATSTPAGGDVILRAEHLERRFGGLTAVSDFTFELRQGEILGPVLSSEDAREGAAAFAEKRAPVWTGR